MLNAPDVVDIRKDESLGDIESARDDVLGILFTEPIRLLERHVFEEELLIVRHLHY